MEASRRGCRLDDASWCLSSLIPSVGKSSKLNPTDILGRAEGRVRVFGSGIGRRRCGLVLTVQKLGVLVTADRKTKNFAVMLKGEQTQIKNGNKEVGFSSAMRSER